MEFRYDQKIIFFDGYCTLCNKSIDWIVKHDTNQIFKFASLQGETAKKLQLHSNNSNHLKTLIYFNGKKMFTHSTGALYIAKELPYPWKLLYIFILVPAPIRDLFYKIISKHRYRWFGKNDSCRIPLPSERLRFLD